MASMRTGLFLLASLVAIGISPMAAQTASPPGAKVYIINL